MSNKPKYFIRTIWRYETLPHASDALIQLYDPETFEVGYHIPQPQYKGWVPNWLINLITKPIEQ